MMKNNKKYFTCPMRTIELEKLYQKYSKINNEFFYIGSCVVTAIYEQFVIDEINKHNEPIILYGCISKKIIDSTKGKNNITVIRTNQFNKHINETQLDSAEMTNLCHTYTMKTASLNNRDYKVVTKLHQSFFQKILNKPKPLPFLVIGQGCNSECTFCHSKFYIGKIISLPTDAILSEYKQLLENNYNFIDIIAENTGSYGLDANTSLTDLLGLLDANTPNGSIKWMIDGLDPVWAVKYCTQLSSLIASKRITVINLPVQSGNERILSLMNRFSDVKSTINTLLTFRKLNPKLYLQGVFIIGFPSETEEEFRDTLNFIEAIRFDDVTFIGYSDFDICKSSKIEGKLSESTINERIARGNKYLREIGIKYVR